MKRLTLAAALSAFVLCALSTGARAGFFESVQGKQFHVTGLSTGTIPVFNEVLVFGDDGSFVMKKMEAYGEGEYYEYVPGIFYFIFTNRSGIDLQYAEAFGLSQRTLTGWMVFGVGSFMIDYALEPMVFSGFEVYQPEDGDSELADGGAAYVP